MCTTPPPPSLLLLLWSVGTATEEMGMRPGMRLSSDARGLTSLGFDGRMVTEVRPDSRLSTALCS
jgi:hypothetical protein